MARTQFSGAQVTDGSIQRADLDVTTAGSAVIRKVIAGAGVTLTYTGPDAGTGDVTISTSSTVQDGTSYINPATRLIQTQGIMAQMALSGASR